MSIHPGHLSASAGGKRSVRPGHPGPSLGKPIGDLREQGLVVRFAPPESVDADDQGIEIELGTDKSVEPGTIDWVVPTEDIDAPRERRSTDEDHPTVGRSRLWSREAGREGAALRGALDPSRPIGTMRGDVAIRAVAQPIRIQRPRSTPDTRLPESVEALDRSLEAGLSDRRKDRRDAEREAQSRDSAEDVGVTVGAQKAGVVVELGEGRQTDRPPMPEQRRGDAR